MTALEAVGDMRQEKLRDMAIAVRASRMEQADFAKFAGIEPPSHDEIYKKHQEGTL